ncbi:MAG TPA: SMP-30/gluconolactonase/LRE family protein [Streptosporangiaceae bacterium]|nr:SMP-30/gluconolactonase/LRE family protein [Streptosporangiaceae bacterium]
MGRSASAGVEVFADLRADVGEAPHWDERSQTLLFVDLTGGVVFRYDQSGAELSSFPVGQEVGAAVPRHRGGLVLAVRDGIAVAAENGEGFELTAPVERDAPGNRMNDAKCDPAGRLLAGTMSYDVAPHAGALYRVDPDWSVERVVPAVTQSNGIAWSPDGRLMYFIDSATQGVDVFGYDIEAGSAGHRRRLVTIERAHGIPDGMTADSQGNVWVACFGGGAVRCFSPAGVLLDEVFLPVSQVTSCAFGGPDLADLYVTSAAYRLSADQLKRQPHAGATFVCRPGAAGLPAPAFAG